MVKRKIQSPTTEFQCSKSLSHVSLQTENDIHHMNDFFPPTAPKNHAPHKFLSTH